MSRRPPDRVPACCKYCTVWSLIVIDIYTRTYHEYNARYGNSVRLSVLDTLYCGKTVKRIV